MTPKVQEIIQQQLREFREKFGREAGPKDPLFFDPDADEPRPYPEDKLTAEIMEAMCKADVPPVLRYAHLKTGLVVTESNQHLFSKEDLEEWNQATDEYQLLAKWVFNDSLFRPNPGDDGSFDLDPAHARILAEQLYTFRRKFGRDPRIDEPIFFDPDASEPQPCPEQKLDRIANEAILARTLPFPEQYAYEKTGLLITPDNRDGFTPAQLNTWDDALEEYEFLEEWVACN